MDGAAEVLPVLPELRELLPDGGLRRGSVVAVDGPGALLWALAVEASRTGAWCATVGLPELGLVAAAEMGMALDRLLVVADPGPRWAEVVATLLDGVELVIARPPGAASAQRGRSGPGTAALDRRLGALLRRHGGVLVTAGPWEGARVRLRVASGVWAGVGDGHGHLQGHRVRVMAEGRGAGGRPRVARLWLPGPDGTVTGPDLAPVGDHGESARAEQPAAGRAGDAVAEDAGSARSGDAVGDGIPGEVA